MPSRTYERTHSKLQLDRSGRPEACAGSRQPSGCQVWLKPGNKPSSFGRRNRPAWSLLALVSSAASFRGTGMPVIEVASRPHAFIGGHEDSVVLAEGLRIRLESIATILSVCLAFPIRRRAGGRCAAPRALTLGYGRSTSTTGPVLRRLGGVGLGPARDIEPLPRNRPKR